MKAGARAVGVAESYRDHPSPVAEDVREQPSTGHSTIAAAVVRADRVVDGFEFGTCHVGGTDATGAVVDVFDALDREDVRYVLVAGIAPAWFNVLDLEAIHLAVDRPVISVSFEASPGLEPAIEAAFDGAARAARLELYRRLPPRERLVVNGEPVFVRAVGIDLGEARDVVRAFTPEGRRPEPLRVARLAARAADRLRTDS